jgi:hypothetical protein
MICALSFFYIPSVNLPIAIVHQLIDTSTHVFLYISTTTLVSGFLGSWTTVELWLLNILEIMAINLVFSYFGVNRDFDLRESQDRKRFLNMLWG